MFRPLGWFRDFTCFAAFLVAYQSFLASGYGQDVPTQPPRAPAIAQVAKLPAANSPVRRSIFPAEPRAAASPSGLPSVGLHPMTAAPRNLQVAADPTDPYITAQAAALGYDPNRIFAFVRDQTAYEAYAGSLRGARGALWSKAGNSLDRASLLVALLGAAGQSARYVQGTLPGTQAQQLIQSMFTAPSNVAGCTPQNSTLSNPIADPQLLAAANDHYWVEYGAGNIALDPNFPAAQPGQVFASPAQRFTAIPDSLSHHVTIRVDAETYTQASQLFGTGNGLGTANVLTQTFLTSTLTGRPLTVGNFVQYSSLNSIFSANTSTYSPYLRVGDTSAPAAQDQVIRGTDYQESQTNFPLGNVLLTGLTVSMDVTDSKGNTQTYTRAMLDRIGYAARQGGTSTTITASSGGPSLTEFDLLTVNAMPGFLDPASLASFQADASQLTAQQTTLQGQLAKFVNTTPTGANTTTADQANLKAGSTFAREALTTVARAATFAHANLSDQSVAYFSALHLVKAYYNSPRLLVFQSKTSYNTVTNSIGVRLALDLRKDDIYAVAQSGQSTNAAYQFQISHGLAENATEKYVMDQMAANSVGANTRIGYTTGDIFIAADAQNVPITALDSASIATLDTLTISAEAKARITTALQNGKQVLVPVAPVQVNGAPATAWYEQDPVTGDTIGVTEDGGHQAIIDYSEAEVAQLAEINWSPVFGYFVGFVTGFVVGLMLGSLFSLALAENCSDPNFLKILALLSKIEESITKLLTTLVKNIVLSNNVTRGFIAGYSVALAIIAFAPPPAAFRDKCKQTSSSSSLSARAVTSAAATSPVVPFALNLGPPATAANPGSTPGVALTVGPDTRFTLPYAGLQLPLVYQAQIQNTGPRAQSFSLTTGGLPAGYTASSSLPSILVPAGQTGALNVCLTPTGQLGTPGTAVSFTETAASISAPVVTSVQPVSFTTPSVPGLTLTAVPQSLSLTPASAGTTVLTATAIGNVPVAATLTGTSPGLTLAGLASAVSLNPGQTSTQTLTLTPAANSAIGSTLVSSVSAAFGSQSVTAVVPVSVVSAQAQNALSGAQAASTLGRSDIATTLGGLAGAINAATANCSDASRGELLAYLNNLIAEMNAPFLANFAASLQNSYSVIASATCSTLGAALTDLSTTLSSLNGVLSSPSAYPFDLLLLPSSALAQPGSPSTFKVQIQNRSTTSATYTLTLSGVPANVTGALNTTSVTLAPGQASVTGSASDPTVTITPPATGISPFEFTVTVSVNGVSGSARPVKGTLQARAETLAVQDVTPSPSFTAAGGSVNVKAHLANLVNQPRNVTVLLNVQDSTGMTVKTLTQSATLSVQSLLTTVDFGALDTTGLANGTYKLAVTVNDATTGQLIPGGTGSGTLLIGSPVTASLTTSPTTLPPGNGQVTMTLSVTSTSGGSRQNGARFSLIGNVKTPSNAESVAVNGTLAYVCDDNEVAVVDIANPSSPTVLATGNSSSIQNSGNIYCNIQRGALVVFADSTSTTIGNNPSFVAFDLTNPQAPQLISGTPVYKRFFSTPTYVGNVAYMTTNKIGYYGPNLSDQYGDFIAVDVSDFKNPKVIGTLSNPTQDATYGNPGNLFGAAQIGANPLFLIAGSTSTGSTNNGQGRLQVIDVSTPSSPQAVSTLLLPGAPVAATPLVQGNTAVVLSNQGWNTPFNFGVLPVFSGPVGIVTLDLTDPRNPKIAANVTTNLKPGLSGGAAVIGPNLFLYAGVQDSSGNEVLMQVDTTDPKNPTYQTFPLTTPLTRLTAVGNLLYASEGALGLGIYSIPGTSGAIPYTATVQVPKGGQVTYDPASFSIAPAITPGSSSDTLTWINPASGTITWRSTLTAIQAGQVLPVALGGSVSFTYNGSSGSIPLPPVSVDSEQILSLDPGTLTVAPGQQAAYTLTLRNPGTAAVSYTLSATGVNGNWVTLAPTVTVPAGGQVTTPVTLRSELAATDGTYNFNITANDGATVSGILILQGTPNIDTVVSNAPVGAVVTLTPSQVTTGPGGTARYTVQVANTGAAADTFQLTAAVPAGYAATFDHASLAVPPGLSNARQAVLQITAPAGATAGSQPFTVTAASSTTQGQQTGSVTIAPQGVAVRLSAATAAPGTTLQFTVTNTGSVADTFTLSLGGPAALTSQLAAPSVKLAAGQLQNVAVGVGSVDFAPLGSVLLTAVATSQTTPAVQASASATIPVTARKGVTAAFAPARVSLASPGAATLLLDVRNTGNQDDAYAATIVNSNGVIGATLIGLDGQPTQSVPVFRLFGLALGQLTVQGTPTGTADGTVTVRVTSQTDPTVSATATGTVGLGTGGAPVADAGRPRNAAVGVYTTLDGSASYDPSGNRLTYRWSITGKPAASLLPASALRNATSVRPFFSPDVAGVYTLQLIVNNGLSDSAPATVSVSAVTGNVPPNANAGPGFTTRRGVTVTLDGGQSVDPDRGPQALSYSWTVQQAPAGSAVTGTLSKPGASPVSTFVPDVAGAYLLSLQVSDGAASSTDTVTITAVDTNAPPVVLPGASRRSLPHVLVPLDGSATYDPDNGPQPLTYQWQFVSAPIADSAIQNAGTPKPSFTGDATAVYVARLTASDGAASSSANASITVANYCDANADGTVDQADIDLMATLLGPAFPSDPLDLDGNGTVDANDLQGCRNLFGPVHAFPEIFVDQTKLFFVYYRGALLPPVQNLVATSDSPQKFTVTTGTSWASVTPKSGTTPTTLHVAVDPTGLKGGLYETTIDFQSYGVIVPEPVYVRFTVYDIPALMATPAALQITMRAGQPEQQQTVLLASSSHPVNFAAATNGGSWLRIVQSPGLTPANIVLSINTIGLNPGVYTGNVSFTSAEAGNSPLLVPVTLTVTP